MTFSNKKIRDRIFVAVEGQSEQAFIKWLQRLCEEKGLAIFLDGHLLKGGGYKSMLEKAMLYRGKGLSKGQYKHNFLIADADRSGQGDCSLDHLRAQAEKEDFQVVVLYPNFERGNFANSVSERKHPINLHRC